MGSTEGSQEMPVVTAVKKHKSLSFLCQCSVRKGISAEPEMEENPVRHKSGENPRASTCQQQLLQERCCVRSLGICLQ